MDRGAASNTNSVMAGGLFGAWTVKIEQVHLLLLSSTSSCSSQSQNPELDTLLLSWSGALLLSSCRLSGTSGQLTVFTAH